MTSVLFNTFCILTVQKNVGWPVTINVLKVPFKYDLVLRGIAAVLSIGLPLHGSLLKRTLQSLPRLGTKSTTLPSRNIADESGKAGKYWSSSRAGFRT
jgi:hypothetical protein